jgi:hypothetical protein
VDVLGVGQLGRQALGVDLDLDLLTVLLEHGVAFGPRAVEGIQLGLEIGFLVIVIIAVVATVGEGHRGEAQRQGHREQQHYGQLSGQLLYPFFLLFRSKRKLGNLPSEPLVGFALLFASPLRLAGIPLTSMMLRA